MQKSRINNKRCPTCGKRMTANGAASIPLALDTKLKRVETSITRTLSQIEAEQGRKAARAALARLQEALKL